MRALLTNDDGYLAPGMTSLISAALSVGLEPVVVAPLAAVTGASRSRRSGARMEWVETRLGGTRCIHIDGSPAACVVFALTSGIVEEVDLCISGINAGENLGAGLTISGTFGAALEAASYGVRAISASRQYDGGITSDPAFWKWSGIDEAVAAALKWCLHEPDWMIANINIPNRPGAGPIARTRISRESYFDDRYDESSKSIVSGIGYRHSQLRDDDDIYQLAVEGRTSITLLQGLLI